MKTRSIESEADYKLALERVEQLWGSPDGSPEGEELNALAALIETYEQKHYPVG